MTTPNPISDLLAALDNDPQLEAALRQRILTRELLELPQKVAELTNTVTRMAEMFDRRLTTVEERVDDLATQQVATNERLDRVDERFDRVDERLDRMDERFDRVDERFDRVDERLDRMDERFDRIEDEQRIMRGQLNNLTGSDYERKVVRRASRLVRRHLGVRNAAVLVAINRPNGETVANLLSDGADRGIITEDDADELDRADMIMLGSSPEGEDVYVVGEISITIDDSDVERASDRAAILRTASNATTHAAVIGTAISDGNRERARTRDVTVIIQNE